jgi:hypothetical protein
MTLMMYYLGFAKVDSFDPTGEFKKNDQVLPKKKGENGKDRAKDIESALDWCRNKKVKPFLRRRGFVCLHQDRTRD